MSKKAIMISIKPKYVAKILNGEKTIEIRKAIPKCDLPIEVYIYCTKDKETIAINPYGGYATIPNKYKNEYFNGKVVAKFTLNKIERINAYSEPEQWYMTTSMGGRKLMEKSCLSFKELDDYLCGVYGYAWHIDNLEIFDKPKELDDFSIRCPKADVKFNGVKGKMLAYKPLTKAPQNFCYVEVEDNE